MRVGLHMVYQMVYIWYISRLCAVHQWLIYGVRNWKSNLRVKCTCGSSAWFPVVWCFAETLCSGGWAVCREQVLNLQGALPRGSSRTSYAQLINLEYHDKKPVQIIWVPSYIGPILQLASPMHSQMYGFWFLFWMWCVLSAGLSAVTVRLESSVVW